jgi:phosphoglycolate phosphatase
MGASMSVSRLFLFDIDATMIKTDRSGLWAMQRAGEELFGSQFSAQGIDAAGQLDTLLIPRMFAQSGVTLTAHNYAMFRQRYAYWLVDRLLQPDVRKTVLPGVKTLLNTLHQMHDATSVQPSVTLGVLTGNFADTGKAKLWHCGIDPAIFAVGAFADDGAPVRFAASSEGSDLEHADQPGPDRSQLPPVAMQRFADRFGSTIQPRRVTIIGDSPHDIRCAKENGCRVLAVATGTHSQEELLEHKPDRCCGDLADAQDILGWLMQD